MEKEWGEEEEQGKIEREEWRIAKEKKKKIWRSGKAINRNKAYDFKEGVRGKEGL